MAVPLSSETRKRVERLFPVEDWPQVTRALEERCGDNLPLLEGRDAIALERFRFAALKVSQGTMDGLGRAIDLANLDWRDLLVAAGFAHDSREHEGWFP